MRQLDLTAIVSGSIVIVFFAFACWLMDDRPFERFEAARPAQATIQAKPAEPVALALAPTPPRKP